MWRRRLFFLSLFAFIVGIGLYMKRDLALSDGDGLSDIPEIVVESLTLSRPVKNRLWTVSVDRAEHRDDLIKGDSMDIFIEEKPTERKLSAWALSGDFHRKSWDINLSVVSGVLRMKDRAIDWRASRAFYRESTDIWEMGPDVYASDGEAFIEAKNAWLRAGGLLDFKGEVTVRWVEKKQ